MFSMCLAALMAIVASEQEPRMDYAAAYRASQTEGKPLMVVVGADWCQACVELKQNTISTMKSAGALKDVKVALVNKDAQPGLAGKLMRGRTIPQIIVYSKKDTGRWARLQLTGYQSEGSVRSLIKAAVDIRTKEVVPGT